MWKWIIIALSFSAPLSTPPAADSSKFGQVAFSNSGAAAAQPAFLRGLALLHDFEYPAAARAFREAQAIDPHFALAFWGEAMTYNHAVWMEQDLAGARAVLARMGPSPEARSALAKTDREKAYLRALELLYGQGSKEDRDFRYSEAMAAVHARFPADVDATAFYALSLLGTAHKGRDIPTYMRAAALLEEVFPEHRTHPGVLHYLIHAYDDPAHAVLGLRAARTYAQVAPEAGHALHMTSHIFLALGMWDDVIAANVGANRVVNEHRAARGLGRSPGCGHYDEWLVYALLQEKRGTEARKLVESCREAAGTETAAAPDVKLETAWSNALSYANMQATLAAEDPNGPPVPTLGTHGRGYLRSSFEELYAAALLRVGDVPGLHTAAIALREAGERLMPALAAAEGTGTEVAQLKIMIAQVEALELLAAGNADAGVAKLRTAAAADDALPAEFGPPAITKPTDELLADQLLKLGRSREAAATYRAALTRAPGRRISLEGLAQSEAANGNVAAAQLARAQLATFTR